MLAVDLERPGSASPNGSVVDPEPTKASVEFMTAFNGDSMVPSPDTVLLSVTTCVPLPGTDVTCFI